MVRVAVAGAAHAHVAYALDEIPRSPALQLVAVSDPSTERAAQYAAPFGAAVFADHRAMLAATGPDVVVVAGVYGDRGRTVVDALAAGCHVVADKPLCTTLDELQAIEDAARTADRTVTLLLEKRYYPETLALRRLVDQGALGPVVGVAASGPHKLNRADRPAWFFDPTAYGGLLNDLCVHDLDLALTLTGLREGTVSGRTAAPLADHPRFARQGAALVGSGTATVTVEASWLTPAASPVHGDYQLRVTGTDGTAELFWARHRLVLTTDRAAPHEVALPPGLRPAEQAFAAFARGELPETSTAEGLAATRLALLAQLSADHDGRPQPWSRTD